MSYTKTTWASGDTVTAEKLNNIEYGIDAAANAFIVTLTPTELDYSGTMDKTPAEIRAAFDAGKRILFQIPALNDGYIAPTSFTPVGDNGIQCYALYPLYIEDGWLLAIIYTAQTVAAYYVVSNTLTPAT